LNSVWLAGDKNRIPPGLPVGQEDGSFLYQLNASREWSDLDVLLEVLKELGAQPLILSRPFNGAIWDANGVSRSARQAYYDKLKALVGKYGFPLVEFEDYDGERLFTIDRSSHTSRLGWVYVNQILDAFYHGSSLPYK
jgi:D-alanine transfer protein